MVRERTFHWARIGEIDKWLACGWVVARSNIAMHHQEYSLLMEWLCDCPMRKPK